MGAGKSFSFFAKGVQNCVRFRRTSLHSYSALHTLECESYYLHKFEEFDELCHAIQQYIRFYNEERYQERYQERLSGLSPLELRTQAV